MPTKFCLHCAERAGFEVSFNVSFCIDGQEEGYPRICKVCGGLFITLRRDEASEEREGVQRFSALFLEYG